MSASPIEEWRPIPHYPGYAASSFGRIKSFKRGSPRILKPWRCTKGYRQITIFIGSRRTAPLVHQLVAYAFLGDPPTEHETWDVHHIHDPLSDAPDNLEYQLHTEHWRVNRPRTRRPKGVAA